MQFFTRNEEVWEFFKGIMTINKLLRQISLSNNLVVDSRVFEWDSKNPITLIRMQKLAAKFKEVGWNVFAAIHPIQKVPAIFFSPLICKPRR